MSDPITPEMTTPLVTHASRRMMTIHDLLSLDIDVDESGEFRHQIVAGLLGHMPLPNLTLRRYPGGKIYPVGKFSTDFVHSVVDYVSFANSDGRWSRHLATLSAAPVSVVFLDSDRAVSYYVAFSFV
jgi:hypothetical protein